MPPEWSQGARAKEHVQPPGPPHPPYPIAAAGHTSLPRLSWSSVPAVYSRPSFGSSFTSTERTIKASYSVRYASTASDRTPHASTRLALVISLSKILPPCIASLTAQKDFPS